MMFIIAGRRGSGVSTVSALLIRALHRAGVKPLLAVDGALEPRLHLLLGTPPPPFLVSLGKKAREGAAREEVLAALVNQRVMEGRWGDLVALGGDRGPGFPSFFENFLRRALARLAGHYRAVVVDAGEGMEEFARWNLSVVDHLLLVGEDAEGWDRLPFRVQKRWGVAVRLSGAGPSGEAREGKGPPLLVEVPHDPQLPGLEMKGRGLLDLPECSTAASALEGVLPLLLDRKGIDTRRILDD